jgi:hypothetical protein
MQVKGSVILRNYTFVLLEALNKDAAVLGEDCRTLGEESNSGPPE